MRVEMRTADRRYGVVLPPDAVRALLNHCRRASGHETGGILLGRYSRGLDCAEVTQVTGAPPDSRAGRTWFHRGSEGLQRLVHRLWSEEQTYYLGEWHSHPSFSVVPSGKDHDTMRNMAAATPGANFLVLLIFRLDGAALVGSAHTYLPDGAVLRSTLELES